MKTNLKNSVLAMGVIALTFSSCQPPKNDGGSSFDYQGVPSNIISLEQGKEMKDTYTRNVASVIEKVKSNNGEVYNATEFTYIDLDSLKKYIAFLEEVERLNKKEISGIRIYFAAKPEGSKDNPGRETMFFAPTTSFASASDLTAEQKQYPLLQNVPFFIQPTDAGNKYVGEFRPLESLLFSKDYGRSAQRDGTYQVKKAAIQPSNPTLDPTSVLADELTMTPPPGR